MEDEEEGTVGVERLRPNGGRVREEDEADTAVEDAAAAVLSAVVDVFELFAVVSIDLDRT